nr:MAG TPA: hypothetical protein [Crassvirales sp.]
MKVLLKLNHRSKDTYTHKDCVRLKRVFYYSEYISIA